MARCDCGNCTVKCPGACYCWSDANDPSIYQCDCIPPVFKKPLNRKGEKNKSKRRMKITAQARFNVCIHNAPLTAFAQTLDKSVPNRILVPASLLTKKVNLRLKNKTFKQIIFAAGLKLKN